MRCVSTLCAVVALVLLTNYAAAVPSNGAVTGNVVAAGMYTQSIAFVQLDVRIEEPGCPHTTLYIPDGPQIKVQLAVALSAMATDKKVVVVTDGCLGGLPKMGTPGTLIYQLK